MRNPDETRHEPSPAPGEADTLLADPPEAAWSDLDDLDVERTPDDGEVATASQPSRDYGHGGTAFDLLSVGEAADGVEGSGIVPVPGVMLIDAEALDRTLGSDAFRGDPDERPQPTSHEDEERLAFVRRYAKADGGLFRRHIVADADTVARLRVLKAEAPNAAAVIDVVERAALLSFHAGAPLAVPPILAVGPPGTGKSRIARRLAEAIGSELVVIDGGATKDQGPFAGHDVGYRGSGPGKVVRALLDGRSSAPCVLVDEVDKVSAYNHGVRPLDALLALLEPTTARAFVDTYVGLPMRAEGVVWLMTANSVAGLPGPLLDRVVVVDMPRLGRAATRDAIRRLFAELLAEHGLPKATLGGAALDRLEKTGLRQARRILGLALGPALAAGRPSPDAADIAGASALVERAAPKPRRPVKAPPARPRAPVGFVHFTPRPDDTIGRDVARPRRTCPRSRPEETCRRCIGKSHAGRWSSSERSAAAKSTDEVATKTGGRRGVAGRHRGPSSEAPSPRFERSRVRERWSRGRGADPHGERERSRDGT